MSVNCKDVSEKAAAYIDLEVDSKTAAAIARHLDDCPGCAETVNAQKQVKTAIREHVMRTTAPVHLRSAIRRGLDRYHLRFGFWSQMRQLLSWQPIPTMATAVIIFFLGSAAFYLGSENLRAHNESAFAEIIEGYLEGEIICVDCAIAELAKKKGKHEDEHNIGLRSADGRIWGILPTAAAKDLFDSAGGFHRHVRINAKASPIVRYVEVNGYAVR